MNAGEFLVGLIRRDIGRKLTALVLAVGLWSWLLWLVIDQRHIELAVREEKSTTDAEMAASMAPALYLVVPPDLIVRSVEPSRVSLDLQGVARDLRNLVAYATIEVGTEDLQGQDEREVQRALTQETFRFKPLEPDLTRFEVRPQLLTITVARREEAEIRLGYRNVQVVGEPHGSYMFDEATVRTSPNIVKIAGPRAAVEAIRADPARLKLQPVDVSGRMHDLVQEVGLDRREMDPDVTLVTSRVVQVTVPVEARPMEMDLVYVPVYYDHAESLAERNLQVVKKTDTLDLRVIGPVSELQGKTTEALRQLLRMSFDWSHLGDPPLLQASENVMVLRNGLSLDVQVVDLHTGAAPRVEYVLEELPGEK